MPGGGQAARCSRVVPQRRLLACRGSSRGGRARVAASGDRAPTGSSTPDPRRRDVSALAAGARYRCSSSAHGRDRNRPSRASRRGTPLKWACYARGSWVSPAAGELRAVGCRLNHRVRHTTCVPGVMLGHDRSSAQAHSVKGGPPPRGLQWTTRWEGSPSPSKMIATEPSTCSVRPSARSS